MMIKELNFCFQYSYYRQYTEPGGYDRYLAFDLKYLKNAPEPG